MSTNEISIRAAANNEALRLADVREREARAREALRQRAAIASHAITAHERAFQDTEKRMDAAASYLPDLRMRSPKLPGPPSDAATNPEALEAYAAQLKQLVNGFNALLTDAIATAKQVKARREATAQAARGAADLEQLVRYETSNCALAAKLLGEPVTIPNLPPKPAQNAELEAIERYALALRQLAATIQAKRHRLENRADALVRAEALSGTLATATSAHASLAGFATAQRQKAQAKAQRHWQQTLEQNGLKAQDLSAPLQELALAMLAQTHQFDPADALTALAAREKQRRLAVCKAQDLANAVPDLVYSDSHLAERWTALLGQLQRVAQGYEDFTPSLEREHSQIVTDCKKLVTQAFTKADWINAISREGFSVLESDVGDELVLVDLANPDTWLVGSAYQTENGDFAVSVELQTDAPAANKLNDEAVIADVCTRLSRAANQPSPGVTTTAQVLERKKTIARARKPQAARKAMHHPTT